MQSASNSPLKQIQSLHTHTRTAFTSAPEQIRVRYRYTSTRPSPLSTYTYIYTNARVHIHTHMQIHSDIDCTPTHMHAFTHIVIHTVQFSHSVMSNSLRPHGLKHTRPPCLSPTPRVYPNPRPLSRWCHPTISSSVVPFFSCLQSFPASGSFQWVSFSHQVAKVLELQLQYQSFQRILRAEFL